MLANQTIHQTNIEVGSYFVTQSGKLYYIDGATGAGMFMVENCRNNKLSVWTSTHILTRRTRVIVPKGGE